jgi:hypothetical protein
MKSIFKSMIAGICLVLAGTAQAQYFDFGTNVFEDPLVAGCPNNDVAKDVSVLSGLNNNLSVTVGSFQKTSGGTYDGYAMARLADIPSNESVKWYVTIEGTGNDEITAVDTRTVSSSTGYVYVTGYFTGSATMIRHYGFPIHHFTVTVTPAPLIAPSGLSNDATYFVTKFDQDGNHIWTYLAGEPTFYNTEMGNDINVNVVGGQAYVYTTGFYRSTPTFYSAGTPITVTGASATSDAIFTAQYTDNGTTAICNWVSTLGETTNVHDHGYGIASDKNTGNVYMTGAIGASIGSMTVSGTSDVVLCKYNSSGVLQWSQNFGGNGTSALGTETDAGRGIVFRKEGTDNYLYVSGAYSGTGVIFTPPPTGVLAGFFTKIKDTGTGISFTERNNIIGTGTTIAYRNTVSDDGRYWYVVGSKTGAAAVRYNNSTIVSTIPSIWQPGVADGFMIVFYATPSTAPTPAAPIKDAEWIGGGEYNDVAAGVSCMADDAVYVCGSYKSSILSTVDNMFSLTNNAPLGNVNDAYLIRYVPFYPKQATTTNIEESSQAQLSMYPNPATDQITVRSDRNIKSAVLMDISGRTVATFQPLANSKEQAFLLSDIKAGIYFLTLTDDSGKTEIKKLAIEK